MRTTGRPVVAAMPFLAVFLVAGVDVTLRGLWPVDETRYAAVAWEMWWRGDLVLPRLLGEPYSHKPPLLFWLIHAGWLPFGVNDLWPRLLPWCLALAQLLALRALARDLAPDQPRLPDHVTWLHSGLSLWLAWAGVLAFDVLLGCCVLMALRPVARSLGKGQPLAVLPLGAWLGLALLAKGPVALIFVLPAALMAPWFNKPGSANLGVPEVAAHGLRVALAMLLALGLAALWVLPAASLGGEAYANAILWGQFAGRVVHSFAHREPWWRYLPWLPLLLFPWSLCPGLFLARQAVAEAQTRAARRLVAGTVLTAFLILSGISGKQLHYLVPLLPLAVLWLALRLPCAEVHSGPRAPAVAVGIAACALAPVALGFIGHPRWPLWVPELSPLLPLALLALAVAGWHIARVAHGDRAFMGPWIQGLGLLLLLQIGVVRLADSDFRPQAILPYLQQAERAGHGWAYLGGYAGEFDLSGRLREPPTLPGDARAVSTWAAQAHPQAPLLRMFRGELPAGLPPPLLVQRWRGKRLVMWRAADIAGNAQLREFLGP